METVSTISQNTCFDSSDSEQIVVQTFFMVAPLGESLILKINSKIEKGIKIWGGNKLTVGADTHNM